MKKLIFFLMILSSAMAAIAQQEKGDFAIQFSGNYISQKIKFTGGELKVSTGNIYLKLGKFVTRNLEVGVKPNISFSPAFNATTGAQGGTQVSIGFGVYTTYSFLTEDAKAVPYIGAEFNITPAGEDDNTINVGPYAGLKYFLNEKVNIDVGLEYLANIGSSIAGADTGGLFMFNVGIGVILGKIN